MESVKMIGVDNPGSCQEVLKHFCINKKWINYEHFIKLILSFLTINLQIVFNVNVFLNDCFVFDVIFFYIGYVYLKYLQQCLVYSFFVYN